MSKDFLDAVYLSKSPIQTLKLILILQGGDENETENEYVGFTDEDYDYQFDVNSISTIDENKRTSISINHILQYNSKNPYHPGYTIKIVRNKNDKENIQNMDRIRQEKAKILEERKFQKEIGNNKYTLGQISLFVGSLCLC